MTVTASAVRSVTLGVTDLERSVAFYCGVFDYVVLASGDLDGSAWADECSISRSGRYVVVGPEGADTGLVQLVSWEGVRTRIWPFGERQHLGHYAVNLRVEDIEVVRDRLQASSERVVSTPQHWSITPEISVWDSLSTDPDGTVLDVFEVTRDDTGATPPWTGPQPVQTLAVHLPDVDAGRELYAALGYQVWFDKTIEQMADFFHLPEGGVLRDVNMFAPGSPDSGRLELVEYVDVPGERQDSRARPGGVGIVCATLLVPDVDAAAEVVRDRGGRVLGPAVEIDVPLLGRRRVRVVRGTGGEAIELVEQSEQSEPVGGGADS